jgi:hypothetical protein
MDVQTAAAQRFYNPGIDINADNLQSMRGKHAGSRQPGISQTEYTDL